MIYYKYTFIILIFFMITVSAEIQAKVETNSQKNKNITGYVLDTPVINNNSVISDTSEGHVKKIDIESGTLTIKHGEIKNLDMPSMTMVFKSKNLDMLNKIKINDKITFKAKMIKGKLYAEEIILVQP